MRENNNENYSHHIMEIYKFQEYDVCKYIFLCHCLEYKKKLFFFHFKFNSSLFFFSNQVFLFILFFRVVNMKGES